MKRLATQEMNTPSARQPLQIIVTAAGQDSMTLAALAWKAIPILQKPESVSEAERLQLAQTLTAALEIMEEMPEETPFNAASFLDEEIPPDAEYEPGSEWEWQPEGGLE